MRRAIDAWQAAMHAAESSIPDLYFLRLGEILNAEGGLSTGKSAEENNKLNQSLEDVFTLVI